MNYQPDLFQAERTSTTITVTGSDLGRTVQRLRELGAMILSFQVKGGTYTLTVILPPTEDLPRGIEAKPFSGNHAGMNQKTKDMRSINGDYINCTPSPQNERQLHD